MNEPPKALERVPLLAHLTPKQRRRVVDAGTFRPLHKDTALFTEGDPAEALYAVIEGRVKLVRIAPDGKELFLHLVQPGESFAEAALFGEGTYPATAIGLEDGQLWALSRARLVELVQGAPDLSLSMLASISRWTRRLAAKLEMLTQRRVEERLAAFLLGRARGQALAPGARIELADARQLIAAQIGTAPEVLSRALRRLEDEGIASFGPREATIHDPDALRALASWLG